jgi:hypothetical protein
MILTPQYLWAKAAKLLRYQQDFFGILNSIFKKEGVKQTVSIEVFITILLYFLLSDFSLTLSSASPSNL